MMVHQTTVGIGEKEYHFLGKTFDSLEEVIEYEKKWRNQPVDEESLFLMIDRHRRDLYENALLHCTHLSNREFYRIMEEMFKVYIAKFTEQQLPKPPTAEESSAASG
jgi:hypothetical protein